MSRALASLDLAPKIVAIVPPEGSIGITGRFPPWWGLWIDTQF
jgi:hypothetical protein